MPGLYEGWITEKLVFGAGVWPQWRTKYPCVMPYQGGVEILDFIVPCDGQAIEIVQTDEGKKAQKEIKIPVGIYKG
jgi:hypothetical protein